MDLLLWGSEEEEPQYINCYSHNNTFFRWSRGDEMRKPNEKVLLTVPTEGEVDPGQSHVTETEASWSWVIHQLSVKLLHNGSELQ